MRWKLKEFERSMFTVFEVIDENDEVIKTFVADQLTYAEKKKKAQLIAAAPELLEKLEIVLKHSEEGLLINGKLADQIFDIINKAKGDDE